MTKVVTLIDTDVANFSTTFYPPIKVNTSGTLGSSAYSGGFFNAERESVSGDYRYGMLGIPADLGGYNRFVDTLGGGVEGPDGAVKDVTVSAIVKYDWIGAAALTPIIVIEQQWSSVSDWRRVYLELKSDGTLQVRLWDANNGGGTILANPATTLTELSEYTVQMRVQLNNSSSDIWEVRLNGSTLASGTANMSGWSGAALRSVFTCGIPNSNSGGYDTVVSYKNIGVFRDGWVDWQGVVRVAVPTANGNYTAWSGTYTDVDETPADGDTTYTESNVVDDRESWVFGTLGNYATVLGLVCFAYARGVTTNGAIRPFIRLGTTDYDGFTSDETLFTGDGWGARGVSIFTSNPATTQPWAQSDFSGFNYGLRCRSTAGPSRATAAYALLWSEPLKITPSPVVIALKDPGVTITMGAVSPAPTVIRLTDAILGQTWNVTWNISPVVIALKDPGVTWLMAMNLSPVVIRLAGVTPQLGNGLAPEPVIIKLGAPDVTWTLGALNLAPVVIRTLIKSQSAALSRLVLPTRRGQIWIVAATAPPTVLVQEGYVWVDTSTATPVIKQYIDGAWVSVLVDLQEATSRLVLDAGGTGSGAGGSQATIVNITGLTVASSDNIIIEATYLNSGATATTVGLKINGTTVLTGQAPPGTGTAETGVWRIIIPRRDQAASLGGYSYIVTDGGTMQVSALSSVPQNVTITSLELTADPNGSNIEIRNVLVRALKSN